MTSITLAPADVTLLMSLISSDLTGVASGLTYDGANLSVPDGTPLATAIASAMADTNWRITAGKAQLKAYAAAARYAKETGGVTIAGVSYATDRDTQAKLTGAYALSQVNPSISIDWKLPSGAFTTLNAAAIAAAATAIGNFVQACFGAEAAIDVAIDGGTITTTAQIDAQLAAVGAS